ncbi:MAG: sulfotransferase domain-containing protein [Fibrobacteria bacterium]|nr:sulfotransferase domain-containing protein [Fibrobacteria bacterium]
MRLRDEPVPQAILGENAEKYISVCVVVTSSGQDIYRTLKSVSGWIDEILVIDFTAEKYAANICPVFQAMYYSDPDPDCDKTKTILNILGKASGRGVLFLTAGDALPSQERQLFLNILKTSLRESGLVLAKRVGMSPDPKLYETGCLPGEKHCVIFFPNEADILSKIFGAGDINLDEFKDLIVRKSPITLFNAYSKPSVHSTRQDTSITPVIIADPHGYCGSTQLMQLLSTSSQIVMDRSYPMEGSFITYLLQLSRFITSSVNSGSHWDYSAFSSAPPLELMRSFPLPAGNLTNEQGIFPKDTDLEKLRQDCFKTIWKQCVLQMKRNTNPENFPVRLYAEKQPIWAYKELKSLMRVQAVFLMRDPRDAFLSHLAGKLSIEKSDLPDKQELKNHVISFINEQKELFQRLKQAQSGADELIIRYEDLIQNLNNSSQRLQDFIGITLYPEKIDSKSFGDLNTSSTSEQAIGSWKNDMDPEIQKLFTTELLAELAEYGYEN